MSSRVIVGAVIVLVVIVGGIMLLVGSLEGGDSDKGDRGTAPAPAPTQVVGAEVAGGNRGPA